MHTDAYWMEQAYREAERAYAAGEVPVGAVVVLENRVIGRGYNQIETLQDPTAHAEMIAITAAAGTTGCKWLNDAVLYVTLEPCAMCAGAMVLARLQRLVFGALDTKTGACGSLYNIIQDGRLNHRMEITSGILEQKCAAILKDFFQKLRASKENKT